MRTSAYPYACPCPEEALRNPAKDQIPQTCSEHMLLQNVQKANEKNTKTLHLGQAHDPAILRSFPLSF